MRVYRKISACMYVEFWLIVSMNSACGVSVTFTACFYRTLYIRCLGVCVCVIIEVKLYMCAHTYTVYLCAFFMFQEFIYLQLALTVFGLIESVQRLRANAMCTCRQTIKPSVAVRLYNNGTMWKASDMLVFATSCIDFFQSIVCSVHAYIYMFVRSHTQVYNNPRSRLLYWQLAEQPSPVCIDTLLYGTLYHYMTVFI